MGDNYLRQQAQNARRRRERGITEAAKPVLFPRAETTTTHFTIKPCDGQSLSAGESLMAIMDATSPEIAVLRTNRKVGVIDGDGAQAFQEQCIGSQPQVALLLRVLDVGEASGVATAEVERSVNDQ